MVAPNSSPCLWGAEEHDVVAISPRKRSETVRTAFFRMARRPKAESPAGADLSSEWKAAETCKGQEGSRIPLLGIEAVVS